MYGRIYFHVEGDTEKDFVKTVLQSCFQKFQVELFPIKVGKKKYIRGTFDRGGTAEKSLTVSEIRKTLSRHDTVAVTTMLDYFQLHWSYGKNDAEGNTGVEKAVDVETKLHKDLNNHPLFVPYIQVHDFEALLFSSPDKIALHLGETSKIKDQLWKIKNECPPNPENIDDNDCPAYRLRRICRKHLRLNEFPKLSAGIPIALDIGLKKIREECPHFNEWLTKLENIARSANPPSGP